DDQYIIDVWLYKQRAGHHAGVGKHHFVGVIQVNTGVSPIVFDSVEIHAALPGFLKNHDWRKLGWFGMYESCAWLCRQVHEHGCSDRRNTSSQHKQEEATTNFQMALEHSG